MQNLTPPKDEQELLARSKQLVGKSLQELVSTYNEKLPSSLLKAKGFVGQLIEWHLGASSNNLPQPDFPHLNIELKTLPLNSKGLPSESTYICTAPLNLSLAIETWEHSRVYKKLSRVLWIPFEADPTIPLKQRRIGSPLLWHLDPETERILKQDWEELTDMLCLGKIEGLSAHMGVYLQIRPKAAHSRILHRSINQEGEEIMVNPKGFYLRSKLTQKILKEHYCTSN
jgi:DNA mismatch repair protein MutH